MTDDLVKVVLDEGKYTFVQNSDGTCYALRHGEPWRDRILDGLMLSMAYRIEELEDERDALAAEVKRLREAMEGAAYLLIEVTEQLRHGKIKTRRNRADNIDAFLASLKGEET